jgi:hypothetical protein
MAMTSQRAKSLTRIATLAKAFIPNTTNKNAAASPPNWPPRNQFPLAASNTDPLSIPATDAGEAQHGHQHEHGRRRFRHCRSSQATATRSGHAEL